MKTKIYYKLTDADNYTRKGEYNEMLWGENVCHKANGNGKILSTDGFIHAYESPEMAVFMNPAYGKYDPKTMVMWECKLHGRVKKNGQLKCGAKKCTTLKKVDSMPVITTEQRVMIAIKTAMSVYKNKEFISWANDWLNNKNRSAASAHAAHVAADIVNAAAFASLASYTSYAAAFASHAAHSAAHAADASLVAANIDILEIIKETIYNGTSAKE